MAFKFIPKKATIVDKSKVSFTGIKGTGITKRLGERGEKAAEKADNLSLSDPRKALAVLQAKKKLEEEARHDVEVLTVKTPSELTADIYQDAAVAGVLKHKHLCVIGAAGTGKTTTLKRMLDEMLGSIPEEKVMNEKTGEEHHEYSIAFISFTGKAVQQMKRALPKQYHSLCHTAHSYLGYMPTSEVSDKPDDNGQYYERIVFRPSYHGGNKRRTRVIVIDEASMFPVRLFNEIVDATHDYVRFIFIGDLNQLPPVMDRSILPFAMMKYPTFELKTIHRQALDNPIIANSQRILQGKMPVPDGKNFFVASIDDGSLKASEQVLGSIKKLSKADKFDPMQDALIVPMNDSTMGQKYLNETLVHFFNPPKFDNGVELNRRITIKAARGSVILGIGDKVMCLANDKELKLTNGQMGVVVDISKNGGFRDDKLGFFDDDGHVVADLSMDSLDLSSFDPMSNEDTPEEKQSKAEARDDNQRQASHITTVRYLSGTEEIEVKYQTVGQYGKIALGYAFTCHKSQGAEYPVVIIAMHSLAERMLTREWLYTAVTRARETVYILCNHRAMRKSLARQAIKGNTLEEKAKSFLAQINSKDIQHPLLPEATNI